MQQLIVKGEGVPDFVLLETLSEDAMLENLRIRYDKRIIYTYIGNVVVSMNPFAQLDIYKNTDIENYRGRYLYERPPHIFALAADAYRSMLQNKENQCVIISGESGAGKTEASKIFMRFIAAVSKSSKNHSVENIKDRLLKSNPLLEAFGNAKTLRNDNSSRFGKYMEIQFERDGAPVGGRITNYLLEKSRIVNRAVGERSFHIFYQLLKGLTPAELAELYLERDAGQYAYLAASKCADVDSINDAADWRAVSDAMRVLEWTADERAQVLRLLAAVLHLGNVQFALEDARRVDTGDVRVLVQRANEPAGPLGRVASLLQVEPASLARALTNRSITTGAARANSVIEVHLDLAQAQFTRDALAKGLYARLFEWVVQKLNSSMACARPEDKLVCGVLDIYGFEIFEQNSFEQFCINYCNEKLQQVFIELTLKTEQEEYAAEGIAWEPVKYFNNKIICDLIEARPMGIVNLLDEECLLGGKATDQTFLDKLGRNFAKHDHFESSANVRDNKSKLAYPAGAFKLRHYAGDVFYNSAGFLEKNRDTLFNDLIMAMQTSKLDLVRKLFPDEQISKRRPVTAAFQFRAALQELVAKLLSCHPHYVRCIKPNDRKAGFGYDAALVRHQVRYLGLLENVRVRRAGFAYRALFERFFRRYKMLCKQTWGKTAFRGSPLEGVKLLLAQYPQQFKTEDFRLGKTKIFLRQPTTLFWLEEQREAALPPIVTKMQAVWRGYRARRRFNRIKACLKIVYAIRAYKSRKWLIQVIAAFRNVKTDPNLGKTTPWPVAPPALQNARVLLGKVHATWRAHTMLKRWNAQEQAYLRQKVLAYTTFKNKKPYQLLRRYEADYLSAASNPNSAKYKQAVQVLFQKFGDTQILFADEVTKVNRGGRSEPRACIVTDQNIYKADPKSYKVKKFDGSPKSGIPLAHVVGLSMSPHADRWLVCHSKDSVRDFVICVGTFHNDRLSELVTSLMTQYQKLVGKPLPVQFKEQIQYNNSSKLGELTTLTFTASPDEKSATGKFSKGKGTACVSYNPNPGPASPRG